MGCNMSSKNVDDEESVSQNVPPTATPQRSSLHKPRVHDVNRHSSALQDASQFTAKDKDSSPVSPQLGKGPSLLSRGEDGESVGSPSFRCYVTNDVPTDGVDIVAAICEQRKTNRRCNSSPLRNGSTSTLHSLELGESKSHKKERTWIRKVWSLRGSS